MNIKDIAEYAAEKGRFWVLDPHSTKNNDPDTKATVVNEVLKVVGYGVDMVLANGDIYSWLLVHAENAKNQKTAHINTWKRMGAHIFNSDNTPNYAFLVCPNNLMSASTLVPLIHDYQHHKPNTKDYPHRCPRCGESAYIGGITDVDCSNKKCQLYPNNG